MNEQIISAVTEGVATAIEKFNTEYILLTGDNDDLVLPVAWLLAQVFDLPITPRRSENELSIAPGYMAYKGITLLPEIDNFDNGQDDVLDVVLAVADERATQPNFEKFIETKVLIIAIDEQHTDIIGVYIPDFPNTKLG